MMVFFVLSSPSSEKPTSFYIGWRRLASIADLCCAAPTSRAAPTQWLTSTAGVMRAGRVTHGTALYTKVAPPAWKSSFQYSVTHTATPNSDETGVWRRALLSFFFSCKMTSVIDVPRHPLCSKCLSSDEWLLNQESLKTSEFNGHCVKATKKHIFV